jgi:hypothetical protein
MARFKTKPNPRTRPAKQLKSNTKKSTQTAARSSGGITRVAVLRGPHTSCQLHLQFLAAASLERIFPPEVTSIVLSVVLTLILRLFS